jgi:hypothetical protein
VDSLIQILHLRFHLPHAAAAFNYTSFLCRYILVNPNSIPGMKVFGEHKDVIQEVNRPPGKDVDDLLQKLEKSQGKESVLLFIQRGENYPVAAVAPSVGSAQSSILMISQKVANRWFRKKLSRHRRD